MIRKKRQYYIDNLRIFLTCLVVLHHLAIGYGGPGLWYYNEANPNQTSIILLSVFIATNQAFFMGMFFMISSYFLEKSLRRKNRKEIIIDKLKRLGIPLIFYALIISPIIFYLLEVFDKNNTISFSKFLTNISWFGFGPLWFVAALLIFTFIALFFNFSQTNENETEQGFIANWQILGLAIGIAIITFIVRIWFPVGWALQPLGFQFAHFPQYIVLFYLGIVASRNFWFKRISYKQGITWLLAVSFLVFIGFPLVFYFGGALTLGNEIFMGGLTIQSFIYTMWEQIVGIGLIVGLIGVFQEKFNEQGNFLKVASTSSYTVFIIHALVLVSISLAVKNVNVNPTLKFLILSPIVLIVCFKVGNFIRKLPYLKKIL